MRVSTILTRNEAQHVYNAMIELNKSDAVFTEILLNGRNGPEIRSHHAGGFIVDDGDTVVEFFENEEHFATFYQLNK